MSAIAYGSPRVFTLLLTISATSPAGQQAFAECSETEHTAVFLVEDIYPIVPELVLLDIAPLGEVTNPSYGEMIAAVQDVQPESDYEHVGEAGPFHLFRAQPDDYGACAIVDGRDGRVIFAGTVVFFGFGTVTSPNLSSHPWSFPLGEPAPPAETVEILPNEWWSIQWGEPLDIAATVVDYLRTTDVVRSFSDCGSYNVVAYLYTPGMGPYMATSLIIISGLVGPPWNTAVTQAPTPPTPASWLHNPAPNPFNPHTTLRFDLPHSAPVRLTIHSLDGRLVTEIANGVFSNGEHRVPWNGRDSIDRSVSSGTYIARLTTANHVESRSLLLLR